MSESTLWIDVRTPEEYAVRHIEDHPNIPHEQILDGVRAMHLSLDQAIQLYCRTGRRSGIAMLVLQEHGFTDVQNAGGFETVVDLFDNS